MDLWRRQVGEVPLRILLDDRSPAPRMEEEPEWAMQGCGPVVIARDGGELRGAGGALRDATLDLREDQWVLAAAASQVLVRPMAETLAEMRSRTDRGADAVLMVNEDGTPGSLLLVKVGLLREMQAVGFVDLKEQGLPLMARKGDVRAIRRREGVAICVRTPGDYVRALRALHGGGGSPLWSAAFGVVEEGAAVAGDVVAHDSVVLSGGVVGRGAVLVRCVVGEGAVVAAGQVCVDRLVASAAKGMNRGGRRGAA